MSKVARDDFFSFPDFIYDLNDVIIVNKFVENMFIIIFLSNCVSGSIFIIFFFLAKFEDFFKKRFKKGTTGNYIIYFEIIFYLIYFDGIKLISNSIIRGGGGALFIMPCCFAKISFIM